VLVAECAYGPVRLMSLLERKNSLIRLTTITVSNVDPVLMPVNLAPY
jgi:hypothetical protein